MITWFLIPDIKVRHSSYLQPNFFLTQALTGHGCFLEYLHRFNLRPSPLCRCLNRPSQSPFHIIYNCPVFSLISETANFSKQTEFFSEEFHITVTKIMKALWSADQITSPFTNRNRYRYRNRLRSV